MGEIQGALTLLETAPPSLPASGPSSTEHDTFTAARTLFYNLTMLDSVLRGVAKEELLPLEALLVQVRGKEGRRRARERKGDGMTVCGGEKRTK
jgi:hypothetical protein